MQCHKSVFRHCHNSSGRDEALTLRLSFQNLWGGLNYRAERTGSEEIAILLVSRIAFNKGLSYRKIAHARVAQAGIAQASPTRLQKRGLSHRCWVLDLTKLLGLQGKVPFSALPSTSLVMEVISSLPDSMGFGATREIVSRYNQICDDTDELYYL